MTTLSLITGNKNAQKGAVPRVPLFVRLGDTVTVTELGVDAVVVKIHADGDIAVRFDDGDEGSYSEEEVE